MPSTYSDILGLELQETGENLNAWGERLNRALRMIDDAQAFEVIPLTGNFTLTNTMNVANQGRKAALAFTDAGLTAVPVVTVPPVERLRYVENRGAIYAITITAGGATASVPPGRKVLVLCDGANISAFDPVAVTDAARIAAEEARDRSQRWAEASDSPDGTSSKSAKTYAGEAGTAASNAGSAAASSAGFASSASTQAGIAKSEADRAAAAVGQIVTNLGPDPVAASPVPASLDISFAEGALPPLLNVVRSIAGTRTDRFGQQVATGINELRHSYDAAGRYLGVAVQADDILTLPTAPWYNTTEGTILFQGTIGTGADDDTAFCLDDGTISNRILLYRRASDGRLGVLATSSGATVINTLLNPFSSVTGIIRGALSFKGSTLLAAINGVSTAPSSSGALPLASLSTLRLGRRGGGTPTPWDGFISGISAIPRALSATDLQNITRLPA